MSARPGPEEDDKSFQVDIFVSFFSILIVVATILVTSLAARAPDRPAQDFRTLETPTRPFAVRGWRLVFGYSELWLVRDGALMRLDMTALARSMAAGAPLFRGDAADDFSAPLAGGLDPGQVMLDLRIRTEVPADLIAERLTLNDPALAQRFVGRSYPEGAGAPHFFVWTDQLPAAAPLFETLERQGTPFRWFPVNPKAGRVVARRDRSLFSLEEVLR